MAKKIEEAPLTGSKFILVGFEGNLTGRNDDFYESAVVPLVQSFENDDIWRVTPRNWVADRAKKLERGERYFNRLTSSEYVLVEEGQYLQIAGDMWIHLLSEIAPELSAVFDDWRTDTDGIDYALHYQVATQADQNDFNARLAEILEGILIAALKAEDDKASAFAYHLYEGVSRTAIDPAHRYLVQGAFCYVMDAEIGLPALEKSAKKDKVYRNPRKFEEALSAYQSENGLR
jgi:hypothetical protein